MKTVMRLGQVLDLLSMSRPQIAVKDIVQEVGLSSSSAHELAHAMAKAGLLHKVGPGKFRLGDKVQRLSQIFEHTAPLLEAAYPVIANTSRLYGETTHIVTLRDERLRVLLQREGTHAVRVCPDAIDLGDFMHTAAAGKVLLAALPEAQREVSINSLDYRRRTDFSVGNADALREQLLALADGQVAVANREYSIDFVTVAAPIRNHAGAVIAAFNMAIPTSRFDVQMRAMKTIVKEAANSISGELGYADAETLPKNVERLTWPVDMAD